jgi:hypothetical protein
MDYKQKYLKYKEKYLKLKKQLGGATLEKANTDSKQRHICVDECYELIYNPRCEIGKTCHGSVKYVWNILTDMELDKTSIRVYFPDNHENISHLKFEQLKKEILEENSNKVYHIDLGCELKDGKISFHTFLIEKIEDIYKIYQSYVAKYTMNEWLTGKLNNEVLKTYDVLVPTNNKYYNILKQLNDDNNEFPQLFEETVKNFGGENCLPKEKINEFLELLSDILKKISNYNEESNNDITEINNISKKIFGPKLLVDDIEMHNFVGYKLSKPNSAFLDVKSAEITCPERLKS